jgi:hypothetical protein
MGVQTARWVLTCLFVSAAVPQLIGLQEVAERATANTDATLDRAAATPAVDTRGTWPRVHIPDPIAAHELRAALDRAWTVLGEPRCGRLLHTFSDATGQSLETRLVARGVPVQEHLTRLVFVDESRNRRCMTGFLAFTEPGSYVVRICVDEFKRTWQQDRRHTVAAVIHEMLHSLGLGENPPSSKEITEQVLAVCQIG